MNSPELASSNLLDKTQGLMAEDVIILSASAGAGKSHQLAHGESLRFSHHVLLTLTPMHNGLAFWQDLVSLLEEKFSLRLASIKTQLNLAFDHVYANASVHSQDILLSIRELANTLKAYARNYVKGYSQKNKLYLLFDNSHYLQELGLLDELSYFIQLLDSSITCVFSGRDSRLYQQLLDKTDKRLKVLLEQDFLLSKEDFLSLAPVLFEHNFHDSSKTSIQELSNHLYILVGGHIGLAKLCIKTRYVENLTTKQVPSLEVFVSQLIQTEEVQSYCQHLVSPFLQTYSVSSASLLDASIIALPLLSRGLIAHLATKHIEVKAFADYQQGALLFTNDSVNFYPLPIFSAWLKQRVITLEDSIFHAAIDWYRQHQHWQEAVHCALMIKQGELASKLVMEAARHFSRRGQYQQARQLINQLPQQNKAIFLLLFENLLDFQQYGHQLAHQRLQDLVKDLDEVSMDQQCQQMLALLQHHYRFLREPGLSLKSSDGITQYSELFLPANQFCPWAWHSLAMEQVLAGEYLEGLESLNKAIYWSKQQGDAPCALASLAWFLVPCLQLGKLNLALQTCRKLEAWLEQQDLMALAMVSILYRVRIIIYREQGDLKLALKSLPLMQEFYDQLDPLNLAYCYWAEFLLSLAQQDFNGARQRLTRLETHTSIHFSNWQLALPSPELLTALLDTLAGCEVAMLSWASDFQIKILASDPAWLDRGYTGIQGEIIAYLRLKITLGSDMTAECQRLLERAECKSDKYLSQHGILLSLLNAQRQEDREQVAHYRHLLLMKAGILEYKQLYREYLDDLLPLLKDYSALPSELNGYQKIMPSSVENKLLTKQQVSDKQQLETSLSALTERETQVAQLVCEGLSNKEIAHQLNIGLATVKGHVSRIFYKLEIKRRSQLAQKLTDLGI